MLVPIYFPPPRPTFVLYCTVWHWVNYCGVWWCSSEQCNSSIFVITPFMSKTKITENNYLAFFFFFFVNMKDSLYIHWKGLLTALFPFFHYNPQIMTDMFCLGSRQIYLPNVKSFWGRSITPFTNILDFFLVWFLLLFFIFFCFSLQFTEFTFNLVNDLLSWFILRAVTFNYQGSRRTLLLFFYMLTELQFFFFYSDVYMFKVPPLKCLPAPSALYGSLEESRSSFPHTIVTCAAFLMKPNVLSYPLLKFS